MPFIEQEQLVKLYNEIEDLSVKKEELRKSFIELKNESNKTSEKLKISNIVASILFLLLLIMSFSLYKSYSKVKLAKRANIILLTELEEVKKTKQDKEAKLEELIQEKKEVLATEEENMNSVEEKADLFYVIQIGAYRKLKIDASKNLNKGFIRKDSGGLYSYFIGEFVRHKEAENFRNQVVKLGFKDAFIVPYYRNEEISLNQALKIERDDAQ